MAAGPATATAQNVGAPKPYDPMKTVDGMFKGSVLRMAYAFKDPKQYGESTKIIISECTKKYQDALDDCEIQILDAKWYLEKKLAENKAKREEKAREASAATAKRKHEEAAGKDQEMSVESPPKRIKADEQSSPRSSAAVSNLSSTKDQEKTPASNQNTPSQQPQPAKPIPQPTKAQTVSNKEESKPSTPQPSNSQSQKPDQPAQTKAEPDSVPVSMDEFPRQTPTVTPAITNDEFTFESMFTDALGDDSANGGDDMNIGLDDDPFGDDFSSDPFVNDTSTITQPATQTQTQTQTQPQKNPPTQAQNIQKPNAATDSTENAFSALLEGVEQFANQSDDSQRPSGNSGGGTTSNNNNNAFTGEIDMGTNIFDSFLNDEFDVGSNHGGDLGNYGDGDGGDINFDDLFGDGT